MKHGLLWLPLLCFVISCSAFHGNDNKKKTGNQPFTTEHILKTFGDCDSDTSACARVEISYPVFSGKRVSFADTLNAFIVDFTSVKISGFSRSASEDSLSVEDYAQRFLDGYADFARAFPDSRQRWMLELAGTVEYSADNVVTVMFDLAAYTGGAHSITDRRYFSFDPATGKQLMLSDIVIDRDRLIIAAESEFRKTQAIAANADLKDAGFWFDGNTFTLNENFGLLDDSLVFFYNPYEIASFALGTTKIKLPYRILSDIVDHRFLPDTESKSENGQ